MPHPPKAAVLDAFQRSLAAELDALGAMTAAARDEATNAESRPENQYDTRALEASYLAAGQGQRLEALGRLSAWIAQQSAEPRHERAAEGAYLGVAVDGAERLVLLAPRGGPEVRVNGQAVQLISTDSPLGRAITGLAEGGVAELESPRGPRGVEVLFVA